MQLLTYLQQKIKSLPQIIMKYLNKQLVLRNKDRDIFLVTLDNPPQANEAMVRAVKEYKSWKKVTNNKA